MRSRTTDGRLLGVFVAAMVTIGLVPAIESSGGEIADLHNKWVRPKAADTSKQLERFEALEKPKHGVTEIGLERTACNGTCPVYTVIFKSDGTFRYVGEENVMRKGKLSGRISPDQFHRLAEYLIESGYMSMEANYDLPMIAGFPSTFTMAVVGEKRKLVRNYGDLGPVKLWALQQSIDSMLAVAEWDGELRPDVSPGNDKP